jgi:hypothetical protein
LDGGQKGPGQRLRRASLDGTNVETLLTGVDYATAIDLYLCSP